MKLFRNFLILFFTVVVAAGSSFAQEEESQPAELGDVFGTKGGYVHPFASIAYMSSDNIYYTKDDPTSDTISVLSIGIWFAVPASRDQILNLNTSSYAPGGLDISREYKPYDDRYQLYFLTSAKAEKYTDETDNDIQEHKIEGFFQYNLKGGMTFEVVGQHYKTVDDKRITKTSTLDNDYTTGLVSALVLYHFSESTRIELEGSNFSVSYTEKENEAKNRTDGSAALNFYFGITEKTKLFAGYENINVDYEKNTINSTQSHMYGGVSWQATEKSAGKIKAGQSTKNFEKDEYDDANSSFVELTVNHAFTPKTSIQAIGSKKARETTTAVTSYYYIENENLALSYAQNITQKLSLKVNYLYSYDKYIARTGDDREDKTSNPELIVEYGFTDWLLGEVGYSNTQIDSNIDANDTTNNTAYIRITGFL